MTVDNFDSGQWLVTIEGTSSSLFPFVLGFSSANLQGTENKSTVSGQQSVYMRLLFDTSSALNLGDASERKDRRIQTRGPLPLFSRVTELLILPQDVSCPKTCIFNLYMNQLTALSHMETTKRTDRWTLRLSWFSS